MLLGVTHYIVNLTDALRCHVFVFNKHLSPRIHPGLLKLLGAAGYFLGGFVPDVAMTDRVFVEYQR